MSRVEVIPSLCKNKHICI